MTMPLIDPDTTAGELTLRLRQVELVVGFGRFSLRHDDIQMILDEACAVAADGLGARFAKVLEYNPAERDFVVRAGVGWNEGVVGHARLGSDLASPAGFAFRTGEAVIANHLATESRFRTPALLVAHGIHRAINVLIGDDDTRHPRFGVLEVDSTDRGQFTRHDIAFLEALANTLADSLEKQKRLDAAIRGEAFARSVLDASPDSVTVMNADGTLQMMNSNGLTLLEIDDFSAIRGRSWETLWPAEEADKVRDAIAMALQGSQGRFQAVCPTARGTLKCWDVVVAATENSPRQLVSIARDITALVNSVAAKDELLREKDLLIQEVHHRVKNSLQMVQNLLSLQARAMSNDTISAVLKQSAARVHTIAAIHDRLYRGGSALQVEIAPYLQGLIEDLQGALGSDAGGRHIRLSADRAVWPASDVPTIGLVLTELVTNALKYGEGTVTVAFREAPNEPPTLTVADEGQIPPDFDPTKSRGLGMRIVTGLLRGRGGRFEVDQNQNYTCFRAVFTQAQTE
jgi:two-component system, sensor histidine kinase PdtaS